MKNFTITLLLILSSTTNPAYADINLTFGVYTSDKASTMVQMFRPLLNALESSLTEKFSETTHISLQVASSYDQGIDDLASGRVDFARMGPASYITSHSRNPDIQLLAMENSKGSKIFYGIICVQEESPIQTLGQLKGHTFAFGNERSTIGRYLSQLLLIQNGIYAHDLANYEYLGRHDRVGTAVGSGQYSAGALKESTFKKLKKNGVAIRELARFVNVTKPWIASADLPPDQVEAIKEVLLAFDDPSALKPIKKQGFLPASDSDYQLIRESMDRSGEFFQASASN